MNLLKAVPAITLALSACAVPGVGPGTQPTASAALTPVTWKENTPRATRAYDIQECELNARGVSFGATEEEIAAGTQAVPQAQREAFVAQCLRSRGYTVTEKPVCTNAQIQAGTLQQGAEFLPPLNSVKCMVVGQGFVV
ncbi:MAG: hypothetical protein AAFY59_06910 [Pseudomonadota bacterium]